MSVRMALERDVGSSVRFRVGVRSSGGIEPGTNCARALVTMKRHIYQAHTTQLCLVARYVKRSLVFEARCNLSARAAAVVAAAQQ